MKSGRFQLLALCAVVLGSEGPSAASADAPKIECELLEQATSSQGDDELLERLKSTPPHELERIAQECLLSMKDSVPLSETEKAAFDIVEAGQRERVETPSFLEWKRQYYASLTSEADWERERRRLRVSVQKFHDIAGAPEGIRHDEIEALADQFRTAAGDPRDRVKAIRDLMQEHLRAWFRDSTEEQVDALLASPPTISFVAMPSMGNESSRGHERQRKSLEKKLRRRLAATPASDTRLRAALENAIFVNSDWNSYDMTRANALKHMETAWQLAESTPGSTSRDHATLLFNRELTACLSKRMRCSDELWQAHAAAKLAVPPTDPLAIQTLIVAGQVSLMMGDVARARSGVLAYQQQFAQRLPKLQRAALEAVLADLTAMLGDVPAAMKHLAAAEAFAAGLGPIGSAQNSFRTDPRPADARANAAIQSLPGEYREIAASAVQYSEDPAGYAMGREPREAEAAVHWYVGWLWEQYRAIQPSGSLFFDTVFQGDDRLLYSRMTGAWLLGYLSGARDEATRITEYVDTALRKNLYRLSFTEQLNLILKDLPFHTSLLLSIASEGQDMTSSYDQIIDWKGLLIDATARQAEAIQLAESDPDFQALAETLAKMRQELSALLVSGVPADASRVAELLAKKEDIERRLSEKFVAPASGRESVGLTDLQAVLHDGEVFVDFYRYDKWDGARFDSTEYMAVITGGQSQTEFVPIGIAENVDTAVRAWRAAAIETGQDDSSPDSADAAWQALLDIVWAAIDERLTDEVETVVVSPSAELAKVPWHLISTSRAVIQVDSPKTLIINRKNTKAKSIDGALFVGGVEFGFGGLNLPLLPFTENEIDRLNELARAHSIPSTILTGSDASEDSVRSRMPSASLVHLATHGIFHASTESRVSSRGFDTPDAPGDDAFERSPLMMTGLALSNFNNVSAASLSGFLTAEELIGLDLSSARLVVLSACNTGRGRDVTGQSVIGLRSSLISAGADSILMSLWSVDDRSTQILMEYFYAAMLNEGASLTDALRTAQTKIRQMPEYRSPYYWAAWTLVETS